MENDNCGCIVTLTEMLFLVRVISNILFYKLVTFGLWYNFVWLFHVIGRSLQQSWANVFCKNKDAFLKDGLGMSYSQDSQ